MDIAEFLLARIAEDEAIARGATPGNWDADRYWFDSDGEAQAEVGPVEGPGAVIARYPDAVHIAQHNPKRVLAECEAKRRIVEHILAVNEGENEMYDVTFSVDSSDVLRLLALPYADHPDYPG